mmetsp:Transcript_67031/g.155579  ORF Transcript_67031/g.155579 Transcript_67031/m.155579 type:complete len:285 (+) Transcript_67031:2-856(+)
MQAPLPERAQPLLVLPGSVVLLQPPPPAAGEAEPALPGKGRNERRRWLNLEPAARARVATEHGKEPRIRRMECSNPERFQEAFSPQSTASDSSLGEQVSREPLQEEPQEEPQDEPQEEPQPAWECTAGQQQSASSGSTFDPPCRQKDDIWSRQTSARSWSRQSTEMGGQSTETGCGSFSRQSTELGCRSFSRQSTIGNSSSRHSTAEFSFLWQQSNFCSEGDALGTPSDLLHLPTWRRYCTEPSAVAELDSESEEAGLSCRLKNTFLEFGSAVPRLHRARSASF